MSALDLTDLPGGCSRRPGEIGPLADSQEVGAETRTRKAL